MSQLLLSLNQAGVYRNHRWLVRDINLRLYSGNIVTLIGPNGSGKSTVAKLALGIIRPTCGSYTHTPRLRIGYVPQRLTIDWSLPLRVDRFMQLTARVDNSAIDQALEVTGVSKLRKAQLCTLSGGEFQRVQLARALVRRPQLLVLDEPVQGVDFGGEIALYKLIRSLRDKLNCGILLVSHDLHVVMAATDYVMCLNVHVCCEGSPQTVAADSHYLRLFGEQAASTIALYRHQHDHTHLPNGKVAKIESHV